MAASIKIEHEENGAALDFTNMASYNDLDLTALLNDLAQANVRALEQANWSFVDRQSHSTTARALEEVSPSAFHPSPLSPTRPPRSRRPSNEAGPSAPPRYEMEGSGSGALLASQAAPLPANPYTSHTPYGMTAAVNKIEDTEILDYGYPVSFGKARLADEDEVPAASAQTSHAQYDGGDSHSPQQQHVSPTSTNAAIAANTLANLTARPLSLDTDLPLQAHPADAFASPSKDPFFPEHYNISGDEADALGLEDDTFGEADQESMAAYAKLSFPDGDYYIKELLVTLGRNMDFFNNFTQQQRQRKVMEEYAQEPSRPSQPDDAQDPSSKSSNSLESRPARALPSNFSEQGGIASYANPEAAAARRRVRKRAPHPSNSSSTTSVAPANLHAQPDDLYMSAFFNSGGHSFVPVHPSQPADIKRISKEHLMFHYDFDKEVWCMRVLGSHATHNNVVVHRGETVELDNMDRIEVYSLEMIFKLPNDEVREGSVIPSHGPFADDQSSATRTSPIRRSSSAIDVEDGDSDEDEEPEAVPEKKQKIKITIGKKKKKKKAAAEDSEPIDEANTEKLVKKKKKGTATESPEAVKKPEKGKKPKAAAKEPAEPVKSDENAQKEKDKEKEPTPPQPVNLEGTGLEGLAPAELPQKRKGPGRPPKNGLVSKRDLSFVNRKKKEYEKRGLPVPPFDVLLQQVREENKIRDAQQKAQATGQPVPDMPVMQSIEAGDATTLAVQPDGAVANGISTDPDQSASAVPADAPRKASPKPKRPAKSPSPMKPEADYTEEELKKPPGTYVHQLDVILREVGKGDLQDIYDKMCKKWPYYKYRSGTVGWQSSVRHNLLQNERFREDGRSGKGRLWAINWDVPLEKEKKRRGTPPPRAPTQLPPGGQWGQIGGLPYSQQSYGAYGQPGVPHQYGGAYASPYGGAYNGAGPSGGSAAYPNYPQNGGPPGAHNQPPGSYPAHGQPSQQGASQPPTQHRAPAPPPTQFQGIVDEIMSFRSQYLSHFAPESEAFNQHSELFSKCTTAISDKFHGTKEEVALAGMGQDERMVLEKLTAIFDKYENLKTAAAASGRGSAASAAGAGQSGVASGNANASATSATADARPAPAKQQAVGGALSGAPQPSAAAPPALPATALQAPAPAPFQPPSATLPAATATKPVDSIPSESKEAATQQSALPQAVVADDKTASGDGAVPPPAPLPIVSDTLQQVGGTKRSAEDNGLEGEENNAKRPKSMA
ncbi:hypothetical protein LTR91_003043 [Friedmanniomyces endolithicus]|uniref:Fork-head domain-containing protein n=1 Tax=Friedmanniomyces endolithicus TaxID=329885 RepID=A0AAN6R084_9PEZI|nr:hypothetical protein LTR57_003039 [Friedmanniomyces endolithicus]KAK1008684.1 hypothetical protein LTR91_003043 [Friedmanniomyces endolithicus]KAK1053781.1 hypothetical protein LTS16_000812 [Friedmanniomyces endolithicus]